MCRDQKGRRLYTGDTVRDPNVSRPVGFRRGVVVDLRDPAVTVAWGVGIRSTVPSGAVLREKAA